MSEIKAIKYMGGPFFVDKTGKFIFLEVRHGIARFSSVFTWLGCPLIGPDFETRNKELFL